MLAAPCHPARPCRPCHVDVAPLIHNVLNAETALAQRGPHPFGRATASGVV